MDLTKEKLMEDRGKLALKLAKKADQAFADSDFAQDYDIVKQRGGEIAYYLAKNSGKTGWDTDNYEILKLRGGDVDSLIGFNKAYDEETGDLIIDLPFLQNKETGELFLDTSNISRL